MLINSGRSERAHGKELLSAKGEEHPAEAVAYAVLLFTLAILPLAFALDSSAKDPLLIASASLVSSFMWVGLLIFSIRTIRWTSWRDA